MYLEIMFTYSLVELAREDLRIFHKKHENLCYSYLVQNWVKLVHIPSCLERYLHLSRYKAQIRISLDALLMSTFV